MNEHEQIIDCALDIGERMLQSGGEVYRVEDTIARILRAYNFTHADVFTITSQIQVNAEDSDGNIHNQFRRVNQWGTDLDRLERLNQLSRDICVSRPELSEIKELIRSTDIRSRSEHSRTDRVESYIGAILAASGSTIFFGGGPADAAATAVLACIITAMEHHINSKSENRLLYYFFCAIITGFIGNFLAWIGSGLGLSMNLDKMLIGCIMLTIPGIAITYSVRDMLLGETITGLLRFVESLLIAASIAGGYALSSILLLGGL